MEKKFHFTYFCYLEWPYLTCQPCEIFLIPESLIKWEIKKIKTSTPENKDSNFLILFLGFIYLVGTQNSPKNNYFLLPDMEIYVCVSGGKQCTFFGKFCVRTNWMIPSYFLHLIEGVNPLTACNPDETELLSEFYQPRTVILTLASDFIVKCSDHFSALTQHIKGDIVEEDNASVRFWNLQTFTCSKSTVKT